MNTWTDTLLQFSEVIRRGVDFPHASIACPNYAEQRGVEVYRNNFRGNLHDTLALAYPVLQQLVGAEFFRYLAKRYIERHDSHHSNLHRYGGDMAAFLKHFAEAQHLAYLPDMVRLEWACHSAYFADDAVPFDLARLGSLASESHAELCWQLHPSCALITCTYPVSALWQAHQHAQSATFDIDMNSGAEQLLVYRDTCGVQILSLAAGSHCWLVRLHQGCSMGAATEETLAAHPDFDVAQTLREALTSGVLIDFATRHVNAS